MVYFVQCNGEKGPIKIGYVYDPLKLNARMDAIRTGNPYPLRIVGTIKEAGYTEERKLHELFGDLHIQGEWFCFDRELVEYIRDNCIGGGAFWGYSRVERRYHAAAD